MDFLKKKMKELMDEDKPKDSESKPEKHEGTMSLTSC
jgi:hypothetical protein